MSSEITPSGCRPRTTVGKAPRVAARYSQSLPGPAESETLSMRRRSMFENRESSAAPVALQGGTVREGLWPNSYMDAAEQSDIGVVPKKGPNKAA